MKLLLIEDDAVTAEFVKWALTDAGFTVDHCKTGIDGLVAAFTSEYDGLILDLNLPDTSGFEITRKLRNDGRTMPILMLTASTKTEDVVEGLNLGADDYLTKPFKVEELKARVRALTRRGGAARTEEIKVGSLLLNRLTHQVLVERRPMRVTPKEYRLLEYFLMRPGQVVTRAELLEKVWEMQFDPQSNVVDAHVTRVRTKLRGVLGAPQIVTVRGFGFMLTTDPKAEEDHE